MSQSSGVYFLKQDERIVYIGKSINVLTRIMNDHKRAKGFNEVEIHWLPASEILDYEREQIALHKPPLNDVGWKEKKRKTALRMGRANLFGMTEPQAQNSLNKRICLTINRL